MEGTQDAHNDQLLPASVLDGTAFMTAQPFPPNGHWHQASYSFDTAKAEAHVFTLFIIVDDAELIAIHRLPTSPTISFPFRNLKEVRLLLRPGLWSVPSTSCDSHRLILPL